MLNVLRGTQDCQQNRLIPRRALLIDCVQARLAQSWAHGIATRGYPVSALHHLSSVLALRSSRADLLANPALVTAIQRPA